MGDQNDQDQHLQVPGARRPSTTLSSADSVFSHEGFSTPANSRVASTDTSQVDDDTVQISSSTPVKNAHYGGLDPPSDVGAKTGAIMYTPHSKTALGRLRYNLAELPKLFVAEVKTMAKPKDLLHQHADRPDATWDDVQSDRLKKLALREFLHRPSVAKLRSALTIDFGARQNMDHIIASLNELDEQSLATVLKPSSCQLLSTKKLVKRSDQADESDTKRPVVCEIQKALGQLGPDELSEMYRSSLTALVRHCTDPENHSEHDVTDAVIEDYPVTGKHSNKIDPFWGQERPGKSKMEIGTSLRLGLRVQPCIDFDCKALHLDLDLVPYIPKGFLYGSLFEIFGNVSFSANASCHLQWLNDILSGLTVRCAYIPPTKEQQAQGFKAEMLYEGNMQRGRRFKIKEFQVSSDKHSFATGGKTHTVESYFNECILSERRLQHPALPLVSDDGTHWYPLEVLFADLRQALAQPKHEYLTPTVQDTVREFLNEFDKGMVINHLRPVRNRVCDFAVQTQGVRRKALSPTSVEFLANPQLHGPIPDRKTQKKEKAKKGKSATLGIINAAAFEEAFMNRIQQGARQGKNPDIKEIYRAKIESADELTNPTSNANLSKMLTARPTVILAITGAQSPLSQELRRFFEREHGVLVVTVTKQHLDKYFADMSKKFDRAPDPYFPTDVRTKLNFILGVSNFETDPSSKEIIEKRFDRLMVAGAHIRTPSTEADKHHPSIASIVATRDRFATIYPGSIRMQRTFADIQPCDAAETKKKLGKMSAKKRAASRNGVLYKHTPQTAIVDLKDMMVERFKAWTDKRPPTSLMFYHDGIRFDSNVHQTECDAIHAAYKEVFSQDKEIKITYMATNRNGMIFDVDHSAAPTLEFSADLPWPDATSKFIYYVHENENNLSEEELSSLTRTLNESSQFEVHTIRTAKALPLIWAEKLARRVAVYARARLDQANCPVFTAAQDQIARQDVMRDHVIASFSHAADPERRLPWKKVLDKYMFYL